MTVRYETDGAVVTVVIDRPEVRNAVNAATAAALAEAFRRFDADDSRRVAVLTGAGGTFCAGYDLKELASTDRPLRDPLPELGAGFPDGPMGPTRMQLGKPVIAAIEGYAVAGGLELALWCDLRVAASDATLGVFNRRFGVPLIDLGTVRLPRMIGQGRALDMILTGRPVAASEAHAMGLVERVVEPRTALASAQALARELAAHPQGALRADRASVYRQWSLTFEEAAREEFEGGAEVLRSGESQAGAGKFAGGRGRHGARATEGED